MKGSKNLLGDSRIIHGTSRISSFFHRFFSSSFFFVPLISYNSHYEKFKDGFFGRFFGASRKTEKARLLPLKLKFSSFWETSYIYLFYKRLLRNLLSARMRSVGMCLCSFGFYSIAISVITAYISGSGNFFSENVIVGAIIFFASLFLLSSTEPLCSCLERNRLFGSFLTRTIGLRKEEILHIEAKERPSLYFLSGMVIGVLTVVFPTLDIILWIIALVGLAMVFYKPEFGIIIIFAAVPFLSAMKLAAVIITVTLSFFIKAMRCKRNLKIEPCGFCLILFMLTVGLGGIFSVSGGSGIKHAAISICIMALYLLITNLVKQKEFIFTLLRINIVISMLVAAIAILQHSFTITDTQIVFEGVFFWGEAVSSTFQTPEALGAYLVVSFPIAMGSMIFSRGFFKLVATLSTFLTGFSMLFTHMPQIWFITLATGAMVLIIYSRKWILPCILGGAGAYIFKSFLPENIIYRITTSLSMSDTVTAARQSALSLLSRCAPGGAGWGQTAFGTAVIGYSLPFTSYDTHSLYLQLLCSVGICGLVVFLWLLFVNFQKFCTFLEKGKNAQMKYTSAICFCSVLGLLILGFTVDIWQSYKIFIMFWGVLALGVSAVNCGQRLDENERKTY